MGKNAWLILAAVLLVLGVGSLFLEGISYVTQETVLEAGPIELSAEQEERIGLPLWLSALLLGLGLAALLVGVGRKTRS